MTGSQVDPPPAMTREAMVERIADRAFHATEGDFGIDTIRDAVRRALNELQSALVLPVPSLTADEIAKVIANAHVDAQRQGGVNPFLASAEALSARVAVVRPTRDQPTRREAIEAGAEALEQWVPYDASVLSSTDGAIRVVDALLRRGWLTASDVWLVPPEAEK